MKHLYLRYSLFACLTAAALSTLAQKQTNHWYFGTMAGLNFNTSPPSVINNSPVNTNEGTASISDVNGNLLFYTDGVDVWNNTHTKMPNGTGLAGDVSTTQSALIVKKPGSQTLFYVFTLPAEGTGNFCYSIVDMTLDNGKGDVTTKNTVLKNNVTEKMSATYHCNGTDVWVAIHELNSKSFYAYLVSAAGVASPVISTTGRTFTKVHGQMKFNTKGTMLAVIRDTIIQTSPYLGKSYTDLCVFDNQAGIVTYSLSLLNGTWQNSYGLEFSPDNSKLYVTSYDQSGINGGNSQVTQYNLSASNIQASAFSAGTSTDPNILRGLQLASDGKIYVAKSISSFLCVIHSPNSPGAICSYTDNAINIDPNQTGSMCMLGLPGFIQNYVDPAFPVVEACPATVAITEQDGKRPSVYFDQGADRLFVNTTGLNGRVTIRDIQGKKILQEPVGLSAGGAWSFQVDELPAGIYLVEINSASGSTVIKFIKSH